jgi:hypothetical protein
MDDEKTIYIRSFRSSVPCKFLLRCVEPKKDALSADQGLTQCGLKGPSFGCLNLAWIAVMGMNGFTGL